LIWREADRKERKEGCFLPPAHIPTKRGFDACLSVPFLTNPNIAPVSSGHFIPLECPSDLEALIIGFTKEPGLHFQEI
jgi:hypothetical protein